MADAPRCRRGIRRAGCDRATGRLVDRRGSSEAPATANPIGPRSLAARLPPPQHPHPRTVIGLRPQAPTGGGTHRTINSGLNASRTCSRSIAYNVPPAFLPPTAHPRPNRFPSAPSLLPQPRGLSPSQSRRAPRPARPRGSSDALAVAQLATHVRRLLLFKRTPRAQRLREEMSWIARRTRRRTKSL